MGCRELLLTTPMLHNTLKCKDERTVISAQELNSISIYVHTGVAISVVQSTPPVYAMSDVEDDFKCGARISIYKALTTGKISYED
jgi:hypothetical protein